MRNNPTFAAAAKAAALYREDPTPERLVEATDTLSALELFMAGRRADRLATIGAALLVEERATTAALAERERCRQSLVRDRDQELRRADREDEAFQAADAALQEAQGRLLISEGSLVDLAAMKSQAASPEAMAALTKIRQAFDRIRIECDVASDKMCAAWKREQEYRAQVETIDHRLELGLLTDQEFDDYLTEQDRIAEEARQEELAGQEQARLEAEEAARQEKARLAAKEEARKREEQHQLEYVSVPGDYYRSISIRSVENNQAVYTPWIQIVSGPASVRRRNLEDHERAQKALELEFARQEYENGRGFDRDGNNWAAEKLGLAAVRQSTPREKPFAEEWQDQQNAARAEFLARQGDNKQRQARGDVPRPLEERA